MTRVTLCVAVLRSASHHANQYPVLNLVCMMNEDTRARVQCRYWHRNLSVIVPVSPYKILYSYVALVSAASCIWQYKFVHKFAGTLDTA